MSRAVLKQRKLEATSERLAGNDIPKGAAWANDIRQDALQRLLSMGLPQGRDEYWRWTSPSDLTAAQPKSCEPFVDDEEAVFASIDAINITFVDGVFDQAQSDDRGATGLEIGRLQDALSADIHWVKENFSVLEKRAQDAVERPLGVYNTAFATDGLVIKVVDKVEKPVNITYIHNDATSDVVLRHIIKIEEGASFTLLETGASGARSNLAIEVDIAEGAAFNHIRTQGRDHERTALSHIFASIAKESTFKSFTLTANGQLTRNESFLDVNGDDAVAHIAGACLGDGDFHHDDTVFITHDAVNCESRQVYKKVLRNGAKGIFQGKILVKDGAQKTDGYQISQGLLLDDDSQFLAKPELEIYADDVACSHGSTVGAIDEQALFYLRSRGVSKEDATDLLTLSFLAEAIEEIEDEQISNCILERLEMWLSKRKGA